MLRRDNEETGRGDISMVGQKRLPEIDYAKRKGVESDLKTEKTGSETLYG